jgi:hypothetical protein
MATVTSAPSNSVSIYEPVRYKVSSLSTASKIEKMVVNIRTAASGGGTILGTLYRDWTRRTGAGPAYSYEFDADISGVLQSVIGPTSSIRSRQFILPATANIDCNTFYTQYYMEFRFLYRDPANNTLADFGDVAYIDIAINAFSIIRPNKSVTEPFISSLYRYPPTPGTAPFQKLYNYNTGAPIPIKLTDYYNLTFNTNFSWYVRIVETLANNTTLTTFLILPTTIRSVFSKIFSVNIGPAYLKSIATSNFDGSLAPNFTTTVSYKVCLMNSSKQQLTEELSFTVMPACQSGLRLAWLNQLAGVDMYTFDARVVTGVEGKSEIGIRPNIWASASEVALPDSRGSYKPFTQRDEYYEVETRIVRAELAEFLSQILTSSEVYIYDTTMSSTNPYRSVIIADGSLEVSDTEEIGLILKFKVYPANQTPTHVQ